MRRTLTILLIVALAIPPVVAAAFSVGDEVKLGQEVSEQAEKEMPPSKNVQWQNDIAELGARLVPFVSRKQFQYHFKILAPKESGEINAFSLPGGYVYFTERMWQIMTPDERAAVMAHEMIHCDRRHAIDMMIKSQQRMLWMLPLIVFGGGVAAGEAATWGNMLVAQRYSRKMEREADELGMKLLVSAGLSPAGSVTSMKKLLFIESDTNRYEISSIFADHPDTQKRVDYLTELAISYGAGASQLLLKTVDDPTRLGNVTAKAKEVNILYAKTTAPLGYDQRVLVKKMLWDDAAKAVIPQTIAECTVLAPGTLPILIVKSHKGFQLADIMPGDGVFPEPKKPSAAAQ